MNAIKTARVALLGLVLGLCISACGSSRYTIVEPASEPLESFSVLEIHEFTSNLNDEDSINLANRFASQLHTAVLENREENPNDTVFEEVVRSTDRTDGVLVLEGVVVSFEKGSRAKRYWIGFGAGKAYCTIQATFTNKATGETVMKSNFDGELGMGFFGGSAEQAVDETVEAFIDYFSDYFGSDGTS